MNAKALFLVAVMLLAVHPAHAAVSYLEITPGHLKVLGFSFVVASEHHPDGTVAFRVVVDEHRGHFSGGVSTSIGTAKITKLSRSFGPPGHELPFERHEHSIVCEFSVAEGSLADPDQCFIFFNPSELKMADGRDVFWPSADIFYARLKNFAPQPH